MEGLTVLPAAVVAHVQQEGVQNILEFWALFDGEGELVAELEVLGISPEDVQTTVNVWKGACDRKGELLSPLVEQVGQASLVHKVEEPGGRGWNLRISPGLQPFGVVDHPLSEVSRLDGPMGCHTTGRAGFARCVC